MIAETKKPKSKSKATATNRVAKVVAEKPAKQVNVTLLEIKPTRIRFGIRATSPMIQHKWSEKAKRAMREKQQQGKKTKSRDIRVPSEEVEQATYRTEDGTPGIPAMALKKAMITAAHRDLGIERTLVRKAIFILCDDPGLVIPFTEHEMVEREDMVRVGQGSSDMRYRPEFRKWKAIVRFEIDAALLQPSDVFSLVQRAGFSIGIGDWRPEKDGEMGRFEIDPDVKAEFVGVS